METNLINSLLTNLSQTTTSSKIEQTIQKLKQEQPKSLMQVLQNKDIQTVLKELLNNLSTKTQTNKAVLDILKNETIFKEFGSFTKGIDSLLKQIDPKTITKNELSTLKQLTTDIKSIDNNILKSNISKSGIFLESHLKNLLTGSHKEQPQLQQTILDDTKAILSKLTEQNPHNTELLKQSNQLLTQIDYYQLLSAANYSNHTYLPFNWDDLENGDINFEQKDQDNFVCHISLQLKHYGDIKINLLLDKSEHISISLFIQQDTLKEKIQTNLNTLRKQINTTGVKLDMLNIFDLQNQQHNKQLEAYTKYQNKFGVDITV